MRRKCNVNITISMEPEVQGLLEQMSKQTGEAKSRILSDLTRAAARAMGLRIEDNADKYKD